METDGSGEGRFSAMAKQTDIQVVLVRSGRTSWDESGRLSGRCDHPLTEEGRAGVEAELDAAEEPVKLGLILCSADEASVETAGVLSSRCGGRVKAVEGLAEMHLGLWEGLLASDLEEKYPKAYRQWMEDPGSVNIPDAESLGEAEDRIRSALAKSLAKVRDEDEPVGVVLRPVAFGLVQAWLTRQGATALWSIVQDGPRLIRHAVPRALLKEARERSRAGL